MKNGISGDNPYFELTILAKYYYHHCGFRKKKISELLIDFLSKYYPKYELNELFWQSTVDKLASKAGSRPLYEISGVKITKSEMDAIIAINNKVLERLMFTMLCFAKLNNLKNPNNNNWVNTDSKEILKCARGSCKAKEREIRIGKLRNLGLIQFSKRNDNLNCQVLIINDDDEEALFVSDFRELGYEYLKYRGENYIRCVECGILTQGNKNGTKKYCAKCKGESQKTKIITCIDCGKYFEVDANVMLKDRCDNCYQIHRKKYKAQKELERYYKNKNEYR